jgi:hypothetical protein
MTALATNLMSGGKLPAGAAKLIGEFISPSPLAGTGTAQSGATPIGSYTVVMAGAETGQTAFILPATAPLGWRVEVYSIGTQTALIFPDVGSQIDALGVNASASIAAAGEGAFRKVSATSWRWFKGA